LQQTPDFLGFYMKIFILPKLSDCRGCRRYKKKVVPL